MKLAVRKSQHPDLALCDQMKLPGLLGVSGKVVILSFRGTKLKVIAADNPEGRRARGAAAEPVTDAFHLELLSGTHEAPDWHRPVSVQAIVETRSDALLAVQQASRWASYSARVAVVPQARLDDRALLEARLRGVWVVAATTSGKFRIAAHGENTAAAGSTRGLIHRMLDELVWEALRDQETSTTAVRSAATT